VSKILLELAERFLLPLCESFTARLPGGFSEEAMTALS